MYNKNPYLPVPIFRPAEEIEPDSHLPGSLPDTVDLDSFETIGRTSIAVTWRGYLITRPKERRIDIFLSYHGTPLVGTNPELSTSDFTIPTSLHPFVVSRVSTSGGLTEVWIKNEGTAAILGSGLILRINPTAIDRYTITNPNYDASLGGVISYNFIIGTTVTFGTPVISNSTRTITIAVTFSNAGSGLTISDFSYFSDNDLAPTFVNQGLKRLSGTGNSRVLTYRPVQNTPTFSGGSGIHLIASNAFTDRSIAGNLISARFTFNFQPGTSNTFGSPSINKSLRQISWPISFHNPGSGLTSSDFTTSGSVTYISTLSAIKSVRLSFNSAASAVATSHVSGQPSRVTVSSVEKVGTNASSHFWDITFSRDLTDSEFNASTFLVSGQTVVFKGYTKLITLGRSTTAGSVDSNLTLTLEGTAFSDRSLQDDRISPAVTFDWRIIATVAWSGVSYTAGKLQGTLTFTGANISGIAASDFEVLNSSDVVQTGWTFDTPSTTATAGTGITIAVRPPRNINASFKLKFKANSVISDGGSTNNAPAYVVRLTLGTAVSSLAISAIGGLPSSPMQASVVSTTKVGASTSSTQWDLTLNRSLSDAEFANTTFTVSSNTVTAKAANPDLTTSAVAVDSSYISADWSAEPTSTQTGSTASATLTFTQPVPSSELTTSDFTSSVSAVTITGISPSSSTQTTYTITFTHPASGNASYTISLNANSIPAASNYLQGPITAITSNSISYDTRSAISVSSDTLPSTTQTAATFSTTITFSQNLPDSALTSSDFTLTSGATIAVVDSVGSQSVFTLNLTSPTGGEGTYTVVLDANSIPTTSGAISYSQGPSSAYRLGGATGLVTYDRRSVIRVLGGFDSFPSSTQTGVTVEGSITFSQTVTGLSANDFTLTSGASIAISGSGPTYTLTVTQPTGGTGTYSVTLNADSLSSTTGTSSYLEGPANAYNFNSVTYDTRVAISVTGDTLPTGAQTADSIAASITLNKSVPATELTAADFTLSNSNASIAITETTSSHSTFNLTITQPVNFDGSYTVSLNANAISATTGASSYKAGPTSIYSLGSVDCDTRRALTASWTTIPSGTQTDTTSVFVLTFGFDVARSELAANEITATDADLTLAITPTTGTQAAYTVTVTNPTEKGGSYTVSLAANAISAGTTWLQGPSAAVTSSSVAYETRNVVTPTTDTLPSDEQTSSTFTATLTFNKTIPASELTASDFTLSNAGASISNIAGPTGNPSVFTLTITNPTASHGTYTVALDANAISASDSGANRYLAGPATDYSLGTVTFDTRAQLTVSWTTEPTGEQTGLTTTAVLTFSHAIPASQLETTDFTITNVSGTTTGVAVSSISPSSGSQAVYTVTVLHPTNRDGEYTLTLNANTVAAGASYLGGPTANLVTGNIEIDVPAASATASWSALGKANGLIFGNLTFTGANVTDIVPSAFEVLDASNAVQHNWTVLVQTTANPPISTSTATADTAIKISATKRNVNGSFKLRLKNSSVHSGGSDEPNAPSNSVVWSSTQSLDTREPTWDTVTFNHGSNKLSASLTFYQAITAGIASADFRVLDNRNSLVSGWTFDTPPTSATAGTPITISAAAPSHTSGHFRLALMPGSVMLYSNPYPVDKIRSKTVYVSNNPVEWSLPVQSGSTVTAQLTFSVAASGIAAADFSIVNSSNVVQTGWGIGPSATSALANVPITITLTPPADTSGQFRVYLKAGSVDSNIPSTIIASPLFSVDNRGAWFEPAFYYSGPNKLITILHEYATGSSFSVVTAADAPTTGWTIDTDPASPSVGNSVTVRATPPTSTNGSFKVKYGSAETNGTAVDNTTP